MKTKPDVDRMLALLNPCPSVDAGVSADELGSRTLARIVATPPMAKAPSRATVSRPWVSRRPRRTGGKFVLAISLGVAVTTVALALVTLPSPGAGGDNAYAATPEPLAYRPVSEEAVAILHRIAERVRPLPDAAGRGTYAYVRTQSWSLFTRVDAARVTSEVVPQTRTIWLATDGSGRVIETTGALGYAGTRRDVVLHPGQGGVIWRDRNLATDLPTLTRQMQEAHPVENGPAERLVAVGDVYREMVPAPRVRAALLDYLAATPGLTVTGTTADRAGRQGIAFSVESDYSGLPTRYTLVLDPATGRLLDSEETLTKSAGKLNVPVPSVIGYTVLLSSRFTDTLN